MQGSEYANLLEYNNCTAYADLLAPYSHNQNRGHIERVKRCNRDLVTGINKSALFFDNASLFNDTTCQDVYESGMIGVFSGSNKLQYDTNGDIKSSANVNIDNIVFQFVAVVPLSMLSEFYEKVPSVVCMNSMDMKIQTNLFPNNSWTVTYGAIDTDKFYPVSKVESNASVGATCPFMMSEASGPDCLFNVYEGCPSITVTPYIGF